MVNRGTSTKETSLCVPQEGVLYDSHVCFKMKYASSFENSDCIGTFSLKVLGTTPRRNFPRTQISGRIALFASAYNVNSPMG